MSKSKDTNTNTASEDAVLNVELVRVRPTYSSTAYEKIEKREQCFYSIKWFIDASREF